MITKCHICERHRHYIKKEVITLIELENAVQNWKFDICSCKLEIGFY